MEPSDGQLVQQVLAGQRKGFDELVTRYQRQAVAVSYRLLGNTQDAMEVTVDSQGRITISPALIAHAALGKDAVLRGSDTCIEIWNPERFAQLTKKVVDTPGDYEELAAGLFKEEA